MTDATAPRTPWHLWVVGILALFWSGLGAMDYVMTQTRNEQYMSQFTPEQLEFFYGFPAWVVAAWAVAVWGGVVAAILVLAKKRFAATLFLAAFAAMLVTTFHNYVLSNGFEVVGDAFSLVISLIIIVIAGLLWWYARKQAEKGVLT